MSKDTEIIPITMLQLARKYQQEQDSYIKGGLLNKHHGYTLRDALDIVVCEILDHSIMAGPAHSLEPLYKDVIRTGNYTLLEDHLILAPPSILQGWAPAALAEEEDPQRSLFELEQEEALQVQCKTYDFPEIRKG